MHKNAFTMIEMVFVIVILGILAAVALPRFAATRTDAQISKGRADIASIRSAIVSERQSRLIQGENSWISSLNHNSLFDGNGSSVLLMYGIAAGVGSGHWQKSGEKSYTFTIQTTAVPFTYDNTLGIFTCSTKTGISAEDDMCELLTN